MRFRPALFFEWVLAKMPPFKYKTPDQKPGCILDTAWPRVLMHSMRKLLVFLLLGTHFGLFAQDPSTFVWNDTFCADQLVFVNGNFYSADMPTGTEILTGQAQNGGDSIIQINFTFLPEAMHLIQESLCANDTLWVNNQAYHAGYFFGEEIMENGAFNGCDSIIQIDLTFLDIPQGMLLDTLCPDASVQVNGTTYDAENPMGMEWLENASVSGCDSLIFIDLSFHELNFALGQDTTLLLGETYCFDIDPDFTVDNELWLPAPPCPDLSCLQSCFTPTEFSSYTLTLTDANGCNLTDTLNLSVNLEQRIYIPNVFNPDAAAPNNRFFIGAGPGIESIEELLVFNRWGELLFQSENLVPNFPDSGWNGFWRGERAQPGVYTYTTLLRSVTGDLIRKNGTVTVL
jgi:hypothetical protein